MIINEHNKGKIGSFKLGYSRGLPSWMAPKLLNDKRQEEYYVTSLYAHLQLGLGLPVTGVLSNENDVDKGADAIIRVLNQPDITIQVTRFTLTEVLKRKNVAKVRVERIAAAVLERIKPRVRLNVQLGTINNTVTPPNNQKLEKAIVTAIADAIEQSKDKLSVTDQSFINIAVDDEFLKTYYMLITLQTIPEGCYSNFYGRDPLYIDLQFDNISFSDSDIEEECANVYRKKNGGQSQILLIWSDMFEVLYDPSRIRPLLIKQFATTSFKQVLFFAFWNRLDMYQEEGYATQLK